MSQIYYAKTQAQILDAEKRYLISKSSTLNNFNTGSRLLTILEAFSLVSSETQNDFYQALLKAIPISIYAGFNFAKLPGLQASGTLKFSRSTAAPTTYPIAIGTQMLLNGIRFQTTALGSITTGNTDSASIPAQCVAIGVDGNISSNAVNTLIGQGSFVNQPEGIESCVNDTAFTGGLDEETDASRLQRFNLYINSFSRSTLKGVLFAAMSVSGIKSVSIVEHLPDYGWITVYADDGTGLLTNAKKLELEKVINGDPADYAHYPGYRAAGISLVVTAPVVHSINITATLYVLTSGELTDAEYITIVTTAIQTYTNTLKIGNTWILNEAIKSALNSNRDLYDFLVSSPSANVAIASNEVAKTNTITIGVVRV
jgi:uncharacterized phage protein gp47/JayE